jgi:dienelactone hydrolase
VTRLASWSLLFVLALSGCGAVRVYPLEGRPRASCPLPEGEEERFAYTLESAAPLVLGWEDADAVVSQGLLQVRLAGEAEVTPVKFEWWRSLRAEARWGPRAPTIVVTPILGGGRSIARSQCRTLVAAGFHVALVDRGPRVMAEHWPIEQVDLFLRRGVAGRRAVVDWLEDRPEVDPARLGAMGISMGGLITTILFAVEPRFESAVIALAGADVPSIVRQSTEGRLVRWREARAAERGGDEAAVEAALRAALGSDPGVMARAIDPRRVFQVTARLDTVVPASHQERLWEELGRPLRYDLPTGHYTGILYLPYVLGASARWWERRFCLLRG